MAIIPVIPRPYADEHAVDDVHEDVHHFTRRPADPFEREVVQEFVREDAAREVLVNSLERRGHGDGELCEHLPRAGAAFDHDVLDRQVLELLEQLAGHGPVARPHLDHVEGIRPVQRLPRLPHGRSGSGRR